MKILFIAAHFSPSLGGVENYVFNLALGLKQAYNAEVVVVTANTDSKKLSIEDYFGMKVYRLPVMMRVSNTPINPLWYFSLKSIIQKEKPDIINAHQPVIFMGDLAAFLVGHIPFVLTYHAGTMKKKKLPIDIIIYLYEKFVLPHTAKKAARIICVSHFVRDTLLKKYAYKVTIISPGVNTSLYKPNPEVKKEEKLVLFIARYKKMFRMKGLYYLIDAIKMLPEVMLHVVGEIEDSRAENIKFVGVKQGEALVEEMQKATVVALPSLAHMESFGMVLIEAMACETPVVGTNIGGIPEVIRDGTDGFIVEPRDSNALALAISKIVSDKELATCMGQSGEAKVRENFTWDTRAALTQGVFVSCLRSPTKPEIVHVISYYPPHLGGMENYAAQVAERFVARGYTVSVYTSNRGYSKKAALDFKARVHYLKSLEFAHTPIIFTLFFRLLALPRYSLMHLHVSQALSPEVVYMISRLKKIPYIAHVHIDADPSGRFGFLLEPYKKMFLKRVLKSAAKIICLSDSQREIIMKKYPVCAKNVVSLRNGVDDSYFVKRIISKKDIPIILYVGRLASQKNVPRLIEAYSLLKEKAQLRIVGEGEDRSSIEHLIKDLKLSDVTLVGAKSGKELLEEYKNADVLAVPSNKEGGAPLVILEALATGLPVIVSDIYGIRELLGDMVLLVSDPCPANFATALDEVLASPDLQRHLSCQAQEKIKSFRWDTIINELEKIYEEVLS